MKNVFKIATVTSCLASFCYGNVSAAENSIAKEQKEVSNRVARMTEQPEQYQNWQAYTDVQETPRKPKHSRHEKGSKYRKQETKGQALKVEENSRLKDIFGWYTDNSRVKVKYTEAKQIGTYGDGKLYVYMGASYRNDLQWKGAFDKGFATHAIRHNGIKFLDSVIELKIKGNARLYTTTLHKNDLGDYIAILDEKGNHEEIKVKNRSKKTFEVMPCASKPHQK